MNDTLSLKVNKAIQRLKTFEPDEGYYLAYSGGKDSDAIKILAELSGVKFEAVHNLTSVDAPETVKYIKSQNDVKIHIPRNKDGKHITMWDLILKKGSPPLRQSRWCCQELKESGGIGRIVITGVRWSESSRRKEHSDLVQFIGKPKNTQKIADELGIEYKVTNQGGLILNTDNDESRRMVEQCYRTRKTLVNPIVDWTDEDVWEFLKYYNCGSNPLYGCRFKRIGCIGCPMAGKATRKYEFERYPKYKTAYINAFNKMLVKRKEAGKDVYGNWKTGEDVFGWWIGDDA